MAFHAFFIVYYKYFRYFNVIYPFLGKKIISTYTQKYRFVGFDDAAVLNKPESDI